MDCGDTWFSLLYSGLRPDTRTRR